MYYYSGILIIRHVKASGVVILELINCELAFVFNNFDKKLESRK